MRIALGYLEKALRIEKKAQVVVNPAGTRLNLCAVLSQLDRHPEALDHAQAAVILLQEELVQHQMARKGDGLQYMPVPQEMTPEVCAQECEGDRPICALNEPSITDSYFLLSMKRKGAC